MTEKEWWTEMLAAERRDVILRLVRKKGSAEVAELQQQLRVSLVTIRRDLDKLSADGLIIRTHGGAVSTAMGNIEPPYDVKKNLNKQQKTQIGRAAANMVKDGETIIIDSGSTTYEMIDGLQTKSGLTIVTNDLVIASKLAANGSINVILVGGSVRNGIYSTWGPFAEDMLRHLNADKTFLAADACDPQRGILNTTPAEVPVKQLMINAARSVVLLADSSKFSKTALAKVTDLGDVHHIITDANLPDDLVGLIRAMGIGVTLVPIENQSMVADTV